ncbi:hypothetical protein SEA_WHITNEY_77 [Gordonia phage Whitney]|nr:hypothetical protein SEA_WHITNEY_77 [Gordonia phage Whitney]
MSDIGFGPVGDPPIIYDTFTTDGYGRKTPLVDRRLLEQAQARIAELEAAHRSDRNERWDDSVAPGGMVCAECGDPVESEPCELHGGGLEVADLVRGQLHEALNQRNEYRAERDHWRAEAEKARTRCSQLMHDIAETDDLTPDAGSISISPPVIDYLGEGRNVASMYEGAADKLDRNMHIGGSNMRASVARTLRDVASAPRRQAADRLESEATADDVVEKVECWCHIIPNCAACQGRESDRLRGDR